MTMKVNTKINIRMDQADIEEAIQLYIVANLPHLVGVPLEIRMINGRAPEGIRAEIDALSEEAPPTVEIIRAVKGEPAQTEKVEKTVEVVVTDAAPKEVPTSVDAEEPPFPTEKVEDGATQKADEETEQQAEKAEPETTPVAEQQRPIFGKKVQTEKADAPAKAGGIFGNLTRIKN